MPVTLSHMLLLSAVIFSIGLFGALTRKSVVIVVMCIELMFNAANIAFIAFSSVSGLPALRGQVFAVFIMVVSACELGLCMGIAILLYRNRSTVHVDEINLMKW